MEFRTLGRSGLHVSLAGLGCNTLGWWVDELQASKVVHAALDAGTGAGRGCCGAIVRRRASRTWGAWCSSAAAIRGVSEGGVAASEGARPAVCREGGAWFRLFAGVLDGAVPSGACASGFATPRAACTCGASLRPPALSDGL